MKSMPLRIFAAAAVLLCGSFVSGFSQEVKWHTDYAKAAQQAAAENKAILLDFTGSDWCPWCQKMKTETLDQAAFKAYAAKNLILVEVDFPNDLPQTQKVKTQNAELKKQYKADGFPTFVLVDATGALYGKQAGYLEGGPTPFIALLDKWHKPNPSAAPASTTSGGGKDDFDSFFSKKPGQ